MEVQPESFSPYSVFTYMLYLPMQIVFYEEEGKKEDEKGWGREEKKMKEKGKKDKYCYLSLCLLIYQNFLARMTFQNSLWNYSFPVGNGDSVSPVAAAIHDKMRNYPN